MGTTKQSNKTVKKLAKEVASKVIEELDTNEEAQNLEFEETVELESDLNDQDIFADVAAALVKKGHQLTFTIYKNTELLASKKWPYSWEELQKEFGAGHYQILCRSRNLNKIMKKQTLDVSEPAHADRVSNGHTENFDFGLGGEKPQEQSQSAGLPNGLMGMLTFLKTFNSDSESKAREAAERERRNSSDATTLMSTMLTSMMQMGQTSSQQTQQMVLEMTKAQSQMYEKISDNTNKMIQAMNDKFERMLSKREDGPSAAQQMKDFRDAEERGYAKAEKIFELIEKKSEEKAEIKAELLSKEEGDGSLMSSLTKSILPLVATQLQKQNAATGNPVPVTAQQISEAQQIQAAQARLDLESQRQREFVENQRRANRPAAPRAAPRPAARAPQVFGDFPIESRKQYVLSKVLEPLADGLVNQKPADITAYFCLDILKKDRISAKDVVDIFTEGDIIKIARDMEIPDMADPWLKQFYAAIVTMAQKVGGIVNAQKPVAPNKVAEELVIDGTVIPPQATQTGAQSQQAGQGSPGPAL